MNVLLVGNGKGSWDVRGRQLGAALHARVVSLPTDRDFDWADLVVLVKRYGSSFAAQAHRHGKPVIWDALDFWSQPADHPLTEVQALCLLRAHQTAIRPFMTIGATEAMAAACDGVYLPHQSWAGLTPTPARPAVSLVGYQGNALYLGRWRWVLEQACAARGWRFVINPHDLSTVDLLVAFRDGPWDGWICREWKSGVKVVNAIAAGRPLIAQASAAVRELQPAGSVVETDAELLAALEAWAPYEARAQVVRHCEAQAPTYRLDAVANRYRQILLSVEQSCVA